jgi:hypothetical protein
MNKARVAVAVVIAGLAVSCNPTPLGACPLTSGSLCGLTSDVAVGTQLTWARDDGALLRLSFIPTTNVGTMTGYVYEFTPATNQTAPIPPAGTSAQYEVQKGTTIVFYGTFAETDSVTATNEHAECPLSTMTIMCGADAATCVFAGNYARR